VFVLYLFIISKLGSVVVYHLTKNGGHNGTMLKTKESTLYFCILKQWIPVHNDRAQNYLQKDWFKWVGTTSLLWLYVVMQGLGDKYIQYHYASMSINQGSSQGLWDPLLNCETVCSEGHPLLLERSLWFVQTIKTKNVWIMMSIPFCSTCNLCPFICFTVLCYLNKSQALFWL